MKCPNCNKKLKDNSNICKYCKKEVRTDIEIYIGKKYNYIKDQPISLSALLFGPFYLLYRKIYQESIILILIYLVMSIFLNSNIDILLKIAIQFILALSFKQLYFKSAKRKIDDIKLRNSEKNQEEINKIIEKEGSTLKPIIIITIFVLYIGIIALMNNKDNTKKYIHNEKIENNTIEKMIYDLPENINVKENTETYQYYTYKDEEETCYIIVSTNHSKKYSTPDEYLVDRKEEFLNSSTNIEEETYNNIKWKVLKVQKDNNKQDIYSLKYNNTIYEISLETSSNRNTCTYPKDIIMNSLKLN